MLLSFLMPVVLVCPSVLQSSSCGVWLHNKPGGKPLPPYLLGQCPAGSLLAQEWKLAGLRSHQPEMLPQPLSSRRD